MSADDTTPYDHQPAMRYLGEVDADWARLIAEVGLCLHTPQPARPPYEALMRAVASQQLNGRAASAMLAKLVAVYGGHFPSAEQVIATEFATLRACGFSGRKIETIQGIAQATLTGLVPSLQDAASMSNDELIAQLITLKGIGQWTVEMFLIYSLERMDILPVDDFAVRQGYRRLKSLEAAPTPKALHKLGEAWSPYRTIAAWYLWRVPS